MDVNAVFPASQPHQTDVAATFFILLKNRLNQIRTRLHFDFLHNILQCNTAYYR